MKYAKILKGDHKGERGIVVFEDRQGRTAQIQLEDGETILRSMNDVLVTNYPPEHNTSRLFGK